MHAATQESRLAPVRCLEVCPQQASGLQAALVRSLIPLRSLIQVQSCACKWVRVLSVLQVGIISASPLSMGLLTPQGPPAWHPAPPELKEAAAAAADYCRGQGLDIAKLALQFAVRWVDLSPDVPSSRRSVLTIPDVSRVCWPIAPGLGFHIAWTPPAMYVLQPLNTSSLLLQHTSKLCMVKGSCCLHLLHSSAFLCGLCMCRNPSISTTLVGMASSSVVQANVQAVLQALGVDPSSPADAAAEKAAFAEVERILAPVKNITWPSGRPDNC